MQNNRSMLFIFLFCLQAFHLRCASKDNSETIENDSNKILSQKPEHLPSFKSLHLYNEESPFNTAIPETVEIDEHSSQYIQSIKNSLGEVDSLILQVKQYSAPVYFAKSETRRTDVKLFCGEAWELGVSMLKNVPIPDFAEPADDSSGDTPPDDCGEASSQDNNMIILDLENRCEYDFWQARKDNDNNWTASWGNAISMDDDGVYDHGISTRGSGLAFLGGLIWPDELETGEINHALVFNTPNTKSGGPVSPATDSDGITEEEWSLPEGALVRLDPALDLDTLDLSDAEYGIAKALQIYGMYLADTGSESGVALYAVDPRSASSNPYMKFFGDEAFPILSHIPVEKLQVIQLSSQNQDWQDSLKIEENRCAIFK